jgi:Mg2+/Co2+ transporter CorC
MIFAEATRSGVIEEEERALMTSVMRLADRPVREVMTPRIELHWIELDASPEDLTAAIEDSPIRCCWWPMARPITSSAWSRRDAGRAPAWDEHALESLMRKPAILPDRLDTMDALRVIQQAEVGLALVHDEYGHLEGIVTPADLLAAIAGTFVAHGDEGDSPMITEREDGSLLLAGGLPADAMADRLGIDLPEDRDYATLAGFALRCCASCRSKASISPSRAGASKWSTWTGARSTSCWWPAPRPPRRPPSWTGNGGAGRFTATRGLQVCFQSRRRLRSGVCQPSARAVAMLAALSSMNSIVSGAWPNRPAASSKMARLDQPFRAGHHDVLAMIEIESGAEQRPGIDAEIGDRYCGIAARPGGRPDHGCRPPGRGCCPASGWHSARSDRHVRKSRCAPRPWWSRARRRHAGRAIPRSPPRPRSGALRRVGNRLAVDQPEIPFHQHAAHVPDDDEGVEARIIGRNPGTVISADRAGRKRHSPLP